MLYKIDESLLGRSAIANTVAQIWEILAEELKTLNLQLQWRIRNQYTEEYHTRPDSSTFVCYSDRKRDI